MWLQLATCRGLKPVWSRFWDFDVVGRTDLVGPRSPAILACNHESFLDPWLISVLWPREIHHLINRSWYERTLVWRAFFAANGTIPVEPDDPEETVEVLCKVLARGALVGIFPEGRISYDGQIQRFRSGVVRVAAASGVPVVPLGLRGTYESIPRQSRFPRPGPVSLHVGEPMVFPGSPMRERPPMREIRTFRNRLYDEVCRLAGQPERALGASRRPRKTGAGEVEQVAPATAERAGTKADRAPAV